MELQSAILNEDVSDPNQRYSIELQSVILNDKVSDSNQRDSA